MVFTLAEAKERFNKTLLCNGELLSLMHALGNDSNEVRIIGGAVRNVLRNEAINDLDLATIHPPKDVVKRVEKAGFKSVPTGIDHGTVTAVGEKLTYEITTLRQDIATDGRHAEVKFGTDWKEDALRRDFTMNALAVDARGNLHDLVDGLDDCLNGKVRFIGDAKQRIK